MKTFHVAIWGIIASILLAVLGLAFNKKWDLGSHPFRVRFRVEALANVVATLCSIREDLNRHDRLPYSSLSNQWRHSLVDLEGRYKEIKDGYDGCRLYWLFQWCSIGMRAGEDLGRAKDLHATGLHLRNEVISKPVIICKKPKCPQDPSQEMKNSCKDRVLSFIQEEHPKYGIFGIWGLNVKGNLSLLTEVSVVSGGSGVVLRVKAGKGCTVAGLKDAICKAMTPTATSDQIHDRLRDMSFILLLDDLWDSIDLQAVGIPELEPRDGQVQKHRRKVVFTASTSGVCARMGCLKIIELKCSNEIVDSPGMMGSYLKVLDFIKSNIKHGMMRIWGMGGVGKSTLLHLVYDYRTLFDPDGDTSLVVLYVKAGKTCTVAKVQKAIVDARKLEKTSDEKSQSDVIRHHLKDKSLLLLVDDLWDDLNLEAVGIPEIEHSPDIEQQHWRKVVFTTRSSHVCCLTKKPHRNTLGLRMERLSEQDAWQLFTREVVGIDLSDSKSSIHKHAKQIVEECGGLPDALKRIGQYMSTRVEDSQWETYLGDLKRSKLPKNIESRLKLSYDDIDANMTKCFLICSLWIENENIPMEDLIRWWIGLGYLDVSDVNKGYSIIHELLGSSMLEKGDNTGLHSSENSHVKIHSMMRKMSLGTMNQGICLPHSTRRSALREDEWYAVEKAWVSEVDTSSNWWRRKYQPSATSIFKLTMLVARHVCALESIRCFKLITFLDLEGTTSEILFTVICELDKLQHLNLSSTTISALTQDLENLQNLKYLYIRHNKYLQTIQEGLIGKLENLRGLDLYCTSAISADCSSLLDELVGHAKELGMLGFTVQKRVDITKLGEFKDGPRLALCMYHFEVESHSNIINLELLSDLKNLRELAIMESSDSPNGLHNDIQNDDNQTENKNDDSQNDIQNGSQNELVAELVVEGVEDMIISTEGVAQCLFPDLDRFKLDNLRMLKKVTWKNAGMSMKVFDIHGCRNLKDVTWVYQLGLLEQLTIARCPIMEKLIDFVIKEVEICFPQLKRLCLEELPQLSLISRQACRVNGLSYVWVHQCGQLKDLEILKSNNQNGIRIDCNQDWWKGLRIRPPYFNPTFHI